MSTALAMDRSYVQRRAPRANGGSLVAPPFSEVAALLAENRHANSVDFNWGGVQRAELMRSARKELVRLALEYTTGYRDVDVVKLDGDTSIVMSGHQPTLFHPGVWFKNVSLSQIAKDQHAIGIHLIVDNDTVAHPTLEAPQQVGTRVTRTSIPLDVASAPRPYEDWQIQDRAVFDAVAERLAASVAPFVSSPLINKLWPWALQSADRQGNLGLAMSQARHQLEADWQLQTLELPVSRMADTNSFRQFCSFILSRAELFREIHNHKLLQYRQTNHIRSQAHPVPLLSKLDGWVEAPYWVWTTSEPNRLPVFVRVGSGSLSLRLGANGAIYEAPATAVEIPDWLGELREQGIKLRPRALTMTMYARLILCDLFLHGIGGAKYDELGDSIAAAFFGVRPSEFMTLSATVLLPVGSRQVDQDDIRQLNGCLRDLWYHPERHVDLADTKCSTKTRRLVQQKRSLVVSPPPSGNRKQWHHQLVAINEQLREAVRDTRDMLLSEREALVRQLQSENVLRSREYSFCLFPETRLKKLLLDLCDSSR